MSDRTDQVAYGLRLRAEQAQARLADELRSIADSLAKAQHGADTQQWVMVMSRTNDIAGCAARASAAASALAEIEAISTFTRTT